MKKRTPKYITVTGKSGQRYTAPVVVQGGSFGIDLWGSAANDVDLNAWLGAKYIY